MTDLKRSILKIEPEDDLVFRERQAEIKITNVCEKRVYFKIRTTAVHQYMVRPNFCIMNAGTVAHVKLVMNEKHAEKEAKHMFMVQFAVVEEDGPVDMEKIVANCPNKMKYKLKCVLDDASNFTGETSDVSEGFEDASHAPGRKLLDADNLSELRAEIGNLQSLSRDMRYEIQNLRNKIITTPEFCAEEQTPDFLQLSIAIAIICGIFYVVGKFISFLTTTDDNIAMES